MDPAIIVAIITTAGAVIAAVIGHYTNRLRKVDAEHVRQIDEARESARKESLIRERLSFHDSVTSPYYPVKDWTKFVQKVKSVCKDTCADRVLILVAVNGIDKPTHASVVWELRDVGESFSYVDVPLDDDYIKRLFEIKSGKLISFKTDEADNTLIGRYYANEGVTESIWAMVGSRTSSRTAQVAYKYMTVATHNEGGFEDKERMERLVNELVADFRGMIHVSGFGPI